MYKKKDLSFDISFWVFNFLRNLFIKNGKKEKANNIFKYLYISLKKEAVPSPEYVFFYLIYHYKPFINIRQTLVGRRKILYPAPVSSKKGFRMLFLWIIAEAKAHKKKNFKNALVQQFGYSLLFKNNPLIKQFVEYMYKLRSTMPFISRGKKKRKRRRKFKY